ncbi:hypothetical protein AAK967_06250 [Atopobiaceae bacterium 24-176]
MDLSQMTADLVQAEMLLAAGQAEQALPALSAMAADAEEYVDRNCHTTNEVQWFSFPTVFDRLAYRRVERDPRHLEQVGEPLDRLYGDLAFALVNTGDYDRAAEALKMAVRWNPMGCGYRLDLAELYRIKGDPDEWLALTFSVFARASEAAHLVRAYCNFARHFEETGRLRTAAACLKSAQNFQVADAALEKMAEAAAGTEGDPDGLSRQEAADLVEAEGLPDGANAEIAVCLLMCATDAADAGDRNLAASFTVRARDLVGTEACALLVDVIRAADTEGGGE